MRLKAIIGIVLTVLLTGMLMLAFNVQPVEASGFIYIKADGSIDPPTAPISTTDNITYTFTDNIYEQIYVERSNIIVDGNGFTLQHDGVGTRGFYLEYVSNVTIQNTNIKNWDEGIVLATSDRTDKSFIVVGRRRAHNRFPNRLVNVLLTSANTVFVVCSV